MKRVGRRAATATAVLMLAVAMFAWWFDARTKPDAVGERFVASLTARHPGTTVRPLDGGLLRVALPSGINIDLRMSAVFERCTSERFACSRALDDALADLDRDAALVGKPVRAALRPVVLAETGGATFGYLVEPLVGPFELRYALVSGLASTFVTGTIARRLGLAGDALRAAALAGLRQDGDVRLVPVATSGSPAVFGVDGNGDPAASLVDPQRMARFASDVGARRLYAIVPTRNALLLAAASDAAGHALEALQRRLRANDTHSLYGGVVAYDADAPVANALSVPALAPAPLTQ